MSLRVKGRTSALSLFTAVSPHYLFVTASYSLQQIFLQFLPIHTRSAQRVFKVFTVLCWRSWMIHHARIYFKAGHALPPCSFLHPTSRTSEQRHCPDSCPGVEQTEVLGSQGTGFRRGGGLSLHRKACSSCKYFFGYYLVISLALYL